MAIHKQLMTNESTKQFLHGRGIVKRTNARRGISENLMQVLSSSKGPSGLGGKTPNCRCDPLERLLPDRSICLIVARATPLLCLLTSAISLGSFTALMLDHTYSERMYST